MPGGNITGKAAHRPGTIPEKQRAGREHHRKSGTQAGNIIREAGSGSNR